MSGFFCHKATPSSNPGFLQISRVQNGASLDVAAKIKLEHGLIILCLKESQPERHRLALFCSLATEAKRPHLFPSHGYNCLYTSHLRIQYSTLPCPI